MDLSLGHLFFSSLIWLTVGFLAWACINYNIEGDCSKEELAIDATRGGFYKFCALIGCLFVGPFSLVFLFLVFLITGRRIKIRFKFN